MSHSIVSFLIVSLFSVTSFANSNPCGSSLGNVQAQIVEGSNRIAQKMFPKIFGDEPNKNVLFSPLNVWLGIHMLRGAAAGQTRREIDQFLAFTGIDMNAGATAVGDFVREYTDIKTGEKIRIANSVWANQSLFQFSPSYLQTLSTPMRSEAFDRDFSSRQSVDDVNQWVSTATDGMIPSIIDQLPKQAYALLLQALFFQAPWNDTFEKFFTKPGPFTKSDGSVAMVEMMHKALANPNYVETSELQMASLVFAAVTNDQLPNGRTYPSKAPSRFTLDIVLPKPGHSLSEIVAIFESGQYSALVPQLTRTKVDLTVPKFKLILRAP